VESTLSQRERGKKEIYIMLYFSRWKIISSLLFCLFFIWLALPNFLSETTRNQLPSWAQGSTVNLGLDLRGGSHLLLEVDFAAYMKEQQENLKNNIRAELRKEKVGYQDVVLSDNKVSFNLTEKKWPETMSASKLARLVDEGLDYNEKDGKVEIFFSDTGINKKRQQVIEQSMGIISRRIDETGTKEPLIQRQGDTRILLQVPGLKDPEQLKRILGKTAKMTFHLVNTQVNPYGGETPVGTRILPSDESDKAPGGQPRKYAVFNKVELSGDMLTAATASFDRENPVVSFRFNNIGAQKFAEVTRQNVNKPFAIVLDGKVITAPNINEPILGGSGVITLGAATTPSEGVRQATELALLLRAGALPAPLKIVEERSIGPSLGADSIKAGEKSAMVATALIMVFMVISYGLFGIFANIGLAVNMIMILGALSLLQATLTLPGIAGIILTMGMAVDANVLIYERIREENDRGRSIHAAIETGFKVAFGTIMDSNITVLIAASVLYYFGSGTVKGFAVTLAIGVLSSMFSATLLTRLMIVTWLRKTRAKKIPI